MNTPYLIKRRYKSVQKKYRFANGFEVIAVRHFCQKEETWRVVVLSADGLIYSYDKFNFDLSCHFTPTQLERVLDKIKSL